MIITSNDVLETLGAADQPEDMLVVLGYSLFHIPIEACWCETATTFSIDIHNIANQPVRA